MLPPMPRELRRSALLLLACLLCFGADSAAGPPSRARRLHHAAAAGGLRGLIVRPSPGQPFVVPLKPSNHVYNVKLPAATRNVSVACNSSEANATVSYRLRPWPPTHPAQKLAGGIPGPNVNPSHPHSHLAPTARPTRLADASSPSRRSRCCSIPRRRS